MSGTLTHAPSAPRSVWVFAVDLPKAQIAAFEQENFDDAGDLVSWPLRDALGLDALDHDGIELFDLARIEDYGFAAYLSEANGMSPAQVAPMADMLDAMTGHVLLVFSSALPNRDVTLEPTAPLRHVATLSEDAPRTNPTRIDADSAKGVIGTPAAAPTRPQRGRIGSLILGLIALAVLITVIALIVSGGT